VDPRYQKHHGISLAGFKNAKVRILDPEYETMDETYSAWTNKTTKAPAIIWEGYGQMAVFRQTLNAEIPAGAITQVRSIRFTVPMDGPLVPVRKGLLIRVIECEGDDDATRYQYTVTSGVNGGLAFDRTIEAESDMSVILPPIVVTP
jgi:hypothetical protein